MGATTTGTARRRAVPWLVLGLWIAVLAIASPFAAKLGDVQHDRAVDYLPASADSTQVAKIQERLPGGEATEMVLVYHRDAGLTAADRATAAEQVAEIAGAHELTGRPAGIPSKDGTTLMYPVASTEPGTDEKARDALVNDVRDIARGGDGLGVEVGGSGALATDASEVYNSLDGPLLYTTAAVVALLLILIYRSPFLWLVPLAVAGLADYLSMGVAYGLNQTFGTAVSGQSSGIMTILVFGVGTDYALLLVSRYREELRRIERPYDAMLAALRGCGPAVLASSGTVAAGLLCLLAADLNSSRGMGPLGTVGVLCALAAMLTLLPALLVLLGRRVFWPLVPRHGSTPKARRSLFAAMGGSAERRPRTVLVGGAVLLGALALGTFALPGNLKQEDSFTTRPDAIAAMETLAGAYPESGTQPISVISPTGRAEAALTEIRATKGVESAEAGRSGGGWTELTVLASAPPQSAAESATIETLRDKLDGSYVGGPSAEQIDLEDTNARDTAIVVPLVLLSVLLILTVLLRSLVAPLILVAAVVAVWGAALGIGGLVFDPLFGFEGTDPGLGLLSFVFLVALGVDYGIFLMHRMREESLNGAEPTAAALSALRTTGGVIASAGLVLAATFAVLTSMPMVQLVELGFVIAVGVLLDTFLVRTYLVTSASVALRRRVWWPGRLSREPGRSAPDDVRKPVGV
ncbi:MULTISPECIES: MMPL family transporter [Streptomyces]|uniref:Integral membrane protein n=5 Tax=Streptomyces TaxID=1883 RepID=Q9L2G4_STRCO|nr:MULTISPECIES: MMPL family transporter [Streptomyces]WOZ00640.1 MMPL family transporter [Streptomyces violaceoruber]MBQ0947857.1 MMPL family transporter [Streptomyces sp. RK76]MCW8118865.1 MMPL family transporter [Streptomyces anthocyanicus]MCZ4635457.1 MMPL family transporter [Streptomyces rubrogriseus]MDX2924061.1 MMPL family transporter [Streptomyces sp. NRRL_B-16638]